MPTTNQVVAALQNIHRPPRTPGAKLRDAIQHAQRKSPVAQPGLKRYHHDMEPTNVDIDFTTG
jgi:hypothetical protein